ncbi:unnamed protein product [Paramecium sonneborni]|uniref:Katanin p80 subunit C-terminal domain-containing protein n=1 Tax=Paramecium sonneborni TaxID=65129 RepID=A0A8S1Q3A6_9CILI|nr:unnamed protein product [Paramecium sonneborni]
MKQYSTYNYKNDSQISCSKFSPYQNQFISVNQNNLLLWSPLNFQPIAAIKNDAQITYVEFSYQNNLILQGTKQGKILILSLEEQSQQEKQASHKGNITILTNFDANTFISGSQDSLIMIHDLRQSTPIAQIKQHKKQINDIVTDKDSFRFICGSQDEYVSLWDLRNYSQFSALFNNQDSINSLLLIKNTNMLFTSGEESIKLWNINEQNQNQVQQTQYPIQKMAFDYQQEILICASQDNLNLFNIEMLPLNNIEINWSKIQDIKLEDDFVQVLEEKEDILRFHKFQLESNNQQIDENQTLISDSKIPFSQLIQFDQCFYPSQTEEYLDQSYDDDNQQSDDIITTQNLSLQFSQILYSQTNKDKYKQIEIIEEISIDHSKITIILNERISKLKPIILLYQKNEIKQSIQKIQYYNDCSVFIDFFSFLKQDHQQKKLQVQDIVLLLENIHILLNSKYSFQIIKGLEIIKFCFNSVKDKIQQYSIQKKQQQNKAIDKNLQNEKIYVKLMMHFDKMVKLPKLGKLQKGKDINLANLTTQIKTEISQLLNKLE